MEGIKKLLGAQTAGLPNWAWLLILGGGIAIAIVAPKLFKGFGGGSDTGTSTDTGTPPSTDMSGYTPFSGGASTDGGGGGSTTGSTTTPQPPSTDNPPGVFPPVQPSPPPPPPPPTPPDQCKERQKCIDYHLHKDCDHIKDSKKKEECRQHWILKCNDRHPCGHSMVPAVNKTTGVWPYNVQPRRGMMYMVNGEAVREEDLKKRRIHSGLPPHSGTLPEELAEGQSYAEEEWKEEQANLSPEKIEDKYDADIEKRSPRRGLDGNK